MQLLELHFYPRTPFLLTIPYLMVCLCQNLLPRDHLKSPHLELLLEKCTNNEVLKMINVKLSQTWHGFHAYMSMYDHLSEA